MAFRARRAGGLIYGAPEAVGNRPPVGAMAETDDEATGPRDVDTWALAVLAGDEWDSPAEIEATFHTQRRVAVGYFLVFVVVTFTVPVLSLTWSWWTGARLLGGMSPSFLMAAVGLYVFFLALGVLAATLADAVEDRMLGPGTPDDLP